MTILLGCFPREGCLACRPEKLKPFPKDWGLKDWGLNESESSRVDGLASYFQDLRKLDTGEKADLYRHIIKAAHQAQNRSHIRRLIE